MTPPKKLTPLKLLLDKMYLDKLPLSETERRILYNEIDGFVSSLERSLFKTSKHQQYDAHSERILAFHDFIREWVVPRGRTTEWGITAFRRRFVEVETTLTLRRGMNIGVPGAEVGFLSPQVRFIKMFLAAKRACKDTPTSQCVENAYFSKQKFAGTRARQHYKKQVEHHYELVVRTRGASSLESVQAIYEGLEYESAWS